MANQQFRFMVKAEETEIDIGYLATDADNPETIMRNFSSMVEAVEYARAMNALNLRVEFNSRALSYNEYTAQLTIVRDALDTDFMVHHD